MLRYFCMCWTFVFFGVAQVDKSIDSMSSAGLMKCSFDVRPGEVRVSVLEDLSTSKNLDDFCGTTLLTSNSYVLIVRLLRNRTCLPRNPVVFSFTSPILALREPEAPLPFTTPADHTLSVDTLVTSFLSHMIEYKVTEKDCALNMMQSSDDECKPRPLMGCVDFWVFSFIDVKCKTAQTVTINNDTIVLSGLHTFSYYARCDCTYIVSSFNTAAFGEIGALLQQCQNMKEKMRECKSLQSFEGAIHNITRNGQVNSPGFSFISAKVTSYTDDQKSFFIALPSMESTKNDDPACPALADDVTVEVHQDVLSQVNSSSGWRLNIGTFWFLDDTLFPVEQANVSLWSPRVVGLDLGQKVSSLKNPVNLTFYVQNTTLNTSSERQCVFWDVKNGNTAYWNSSGCKTVVEVGKVTCVCNHLSFFAVLMTPVGVVAPLTAAEVFSLMVLSRVGCSVSLAFLIMTLLTHAFYKKGPSENSLWIHLHVCVALLLLNLTFLINDFLTALRVPAVCVAMAALTHYALLSVLTWFAIEGLHLYLLFIRVFNIHIRRYLLKLSLLGWGLPAVPVLVSVSLELYGELTIKNQEGGTTAICWMQGKMPVLMIVTYCYFLLVLLFNITMYSVVLYQVLKARRHSTVPQDRGLNWGMVLSLLGLSWLLGVSWSIMSMSTVAPLQKVTFYMFCTINGLHGFFLFVRYCSLLRKEKKAISIATSTLTAPHISKTN